MAKMAESQVEKNTKTQHLKMIGDADLIASWNCAYPNLFDCSRRANSWKREIKSVVPDWHGGHCPSKVATSDSSARSRQNRLYPRDRSYPVTCRQNRNLRVN